MSGDAFGPGVDAILVKGKRFSIVKKIGEGTFSKVFMCRLSDTAGNLEGEFRRGAIAIKRTTLTPEQVQKAHAEMSLVETLQHPNIVRYLAVETANIRGSCQVTMAMEYCPTTVFEKMRELQTAHGFFKPPEVLAIFASVCSAVQYLHAQEPPITHRDLKPENILISDQGQYKLCDFGSATTVAYRCQSRYDVNVATEDIERNTTLLYRAPEMVDPWCKHRIDQQTDIWALGVLLYYLMFFKFPFEETSLAVLNGVYEVPRTPGYPRALLDVLGKCLVKDPAQRWTIFDLTRHLSNALEVDPALLRPLPVNTMQQMVVSSEGDNARKASAPIPVTSTTTSSASGLFSMLQWSGGSAACKGPPQPKSPPQPSAIAPSHGASALGPAPPASNPRSSSSSVTSPAERMISPNYQYPRALGAGVFPYPSIDDLMSPSTNTSQRMSFVSSTTLSRQESTAMSPATGNPPPVDLFNAFWSEGGGSGSFPVAAKVPEFVGHTAQTTPTPSVTSNGRRFSNDRDLLEAFSRDSTPPPANLARPTSSDPLSEILKGFDSGPGFSSRGRNL